MVIFLFRVSFPFIAVYDNFKPKNGIYSVIDQ